jgi:hypothetical protein
VTGQRRGARRRLYRVGEQGEGQEHVAKEINAESKDIDKAVREAASEVS